MADEYRVLFVCTGNICRSAYADVVARARGVAGVAFSSAGTHAVVGAGLNPPMAAHLPDGVTPRHRARQLTRALAEEADLIVAMDASHRRYVFEEWQELGTKTFVIGHVARELGRLPEGVDLDGLAAHLWRNRAASAGDDVADPYGRGAVAAATAAREIDERLAPLLAVLRRLSRGSIGFDTPAR